MGLASIRFTSESSTKTNSRMFTTEFTENTEGASGSKFGELRSEYPGRNITVIDLAPDSKIGLVGPMSNYDAQPQLVEDRTGVRGWRFPVRNHRLTTVVARS